MSNKMNGKSKLIIAIAAAVIVIAAVLIGIFAVKPAIDKNNLETTSTTGNAANSNIEGRYEFVDYNGAKLPKEFVDILNKADEDNKASCKKNGAAMKIGEREFSPSLLTLFYLDQYRVQMRAVEYAISERGSNVTGYDTMALPDEQKHLNDDYTWADDFIYKSAETMQTHYSIFDLALKNGISLSDNEISRLIQSYNRVYDYVLNTDKTVDEYVSGVYGEGTTFAMFAAREIISYYATKYQDLTIEEYHNALTEAEIEKACKENTSDYQVVKARVFPIESEYDAAEISKINTEAEFFAFAEGNTMQANYNAEVATQSFYTPKSTIESTYGPEVAEWIFDGKRVAGEVGLVEGMIYKYLVYIDTPAFFSTTKDLIVYEYYLMGDETTEVLEEKYHEVEKLYESWKDMPQEEFLKACEDTGYGSRKDVRTGDYYYEMNNWVMDASRKAGDTAFFADTNGLYIVYFVENNAEDFDWKINARKILSTEKFNAEFEAGLKDYEVEYFDSGIKKTYKAANKRISQNIKKAKEEGQ